MSEAAQAETPTVEPQMMTVDDAVLAMPDIDSMEQGLPDRGDDGQFRSREPVQEAEATEVKPETAEKDETEQAAEDDIDYIELEAEEGQEPTRIKLEDAVERYQKFEQIQAELENAKQTQLPPTDWDQQALQHVQAMQQLNDTIEQWQYLNPIQDPDPSLALEDPEQFYALTQQAQHLRGQHQQAQLARQQAQQQLQARQDQLDNVLWEREKAKIFENHPQLQDQAVVLEVTKDLGKHYGIDAETVNELRNHKAWNIIMDALAHRKALGQREVVAKAVKAKPRLVKSQARDGSTPKQRAQSQARDRLAQSGSIADAAEALDAFL